MKNAGRRRVWTARRIHYWLAVVLAVPMVLEAATGVLIAMRSISDVKVPMSWLGAESVPARLPMTAYLEMPGGTKWIGNSQGLTRVEHGRASPVAHFVGEEIVGLAALPDKASPVVATRMAIWSGHDGQWRASIRGRVRQLSSLPDGHVLAIVGGRGETADSRPMSSRDGLEWSPYLPAQQANEALPVLESPSVPLHQLMRELHSGAYFLGKGPGEILWSNVTGWVLVALSLTGLWLWRVTERAKAASRVRRGTDQQGRPSYETKVC